MKRIGILFPSSGVSLHITRIPMRMPTYEALMHIADSLEEASRLLADARVDIIAFTCTGGSLIGRKGYDRRIVDRIGQATGLPATTTTTAVIAGLRVLSVKKLILATPYVELINQKERTFLEEEGFQVLSHRGLGLDNACQQYEMEPLRWYELVKEMQEPQSDSYFVNCGGIRVVDIIGQLETDLGKSVVTSNQALVWHRLRMIGLQEPIEGFGCLLKTPLDC